MTRIIGHAVVKDEANKFLHSCLDWNERFFDRMHIYDGGSADNTVGIAEMYTPFVNQHPEDGIGFYEHEGKYRTQAWETLRFTGICEDDWVFCFDADEFIVGDVAGLHSMAAAADAQGKVSVALRRYEAWESQKDRLQIRVDGWWNRDVVPRLVKWRPEGVMRNAKLGCGSVPQYGMAGPVTGLSTCSLLHLGYTLEGEAKRKHDLYSGTPGDHHAQSHIRSIVATPKLIDFPLEEPDWWIGLQ